MMRRTWSLLDEAFEAFEILEGIGRRLFEVSLVDDEVEVAMEVMDSFLNKLLLENGIRRFDS